LKRLVRVETGVEAEPRHHCCKRTHHRDDRLRAPNVGPNRADLELTPPNGKEGIMKIAELLSVEFTTISASPELLVAFVRQMQR
jgi:hypothetical protein